MTIKIDSKVKITDFDHLYLRLEASPQDTVHLSLPNKLDNKDFGLVCSILQFAATWMNKAFSGDLILPISSNDEIEIKSIVYQEFIYPIIVLSWEKRIVNLHNVDIRKELAKPSKDFFHDMSYFNLPQRDLVPIYCFDHDLSKRGYPITFYDRGILLEKDALEFTLFPAFQKIRDYFSRHVFNKSVQTVLPDFYEIIHELFANTDEHARTSANGDNLYPNIRGVYLSFNKKKPETYKEIYRDFPGLVDYFDSNFKLNTNGELYLVEISVLDSGPGLVARYKKDDNIDVSPAEEVDIIKQCLYRHNTSSTGLSKEIKGLGLDLVLQTINEKGFVRIKTGHADVFRDMRNNLYNNHDNYSDIELYDWHLNSKTEFQRNPKTKGTLISIIYPLDFTEYE